MARYVLVVVDSLPRRLVVASLLGVLEVANVPDEGRSMTVGTRSASIILIVLVIQDEPLLVLLVQNPALVSVGGALVGGHRHE